MTLASLHLYSQQRNHIALGIISLSTQCAVSEAGAPSASEHTVCGGGQSRFGPNLSSIDQGPAAAGRSTWRSLLHGRNLRILRRFILVQLGSTNKPLSGEAALSNVERFLRQPCLHHIAYISKKCGAHCMAAAPTSRFSRMRSQQST